MACGLKRACHEQHAGGENGEVGMASQGFTLERGKGGEDWDELSPCPSLVARLGKGDVAV